MKRVARLEVEVARRGKGVGEMRLIEVMFGPLALHGSWAGPGRQDRISRATKRRDRQLLARLPKGRTHDI